MAPSSGVLAPIAMRIMRHVFKKTQNLIRARPTELLEPVIVRSGPRHQAAWFRQSNVRWHTQNNVNTAIRRFFSTRTVEVVKRSRTNFPKSRIGTTINQLTARAPFASTLRPNLTGGVFPRTSGGYSLGSGRLGGARYFSHTSAAPAQVVNNVSTAMRAFFLSGHNAQFDGMSPAGNKQYRSITNLQNEASRKMLDKYAFGSFIDFSISPTVTGLSPLSVAFPYGSATKGGMQTLTSEGLLDVLSVDFARVLKDLAAVMNDLKRLSSLGDLPITLEGNSVLRVRFPGCDMETVERLCEELGVQRGIVHQDADFDASVGAHMALLFPLAPMSERALSSPGGSVRSQISHGYNHGVESINSPWLSSPEDFENVEETMSMYFTQSNQSPKTSCFEGVEGLYRFLEECR